MGEPKVEPLVLLEDEPVRGFAQDELGLKGFSRTVAGAALGNGGPFTIGVYGGWGQGKTSVLKQAKSLLDQLHADTTVTVFFNAWQFEREKEPLIPLVAIIVTEVHRQLQRENQKPAGSAIKAWLEPVEGALASLLAASTLKVTLPLPGGVKAEWGVDYDKAIQAYRKRIAQGKPVVQPTAYLEAFAALDNASRFQVDADKTYERPRIVVFVDDLDRCLPPRALRLLESIKLVLNHPGFIFVLGVSQRVVEGYLEHRYGTAGDRDLGRRYLDKIVQLPLPVPMHKPRFRGYIQGLLQREALKAPSNRPVKEAVEALADVLGVGSAFTPRRLIRFINNLIIDQALRKALDQPVDKGWLELCAVARMVSAELKDDEYQQLIDDQSLCAQVAGESEAAEALKELRTDRDIPLTAAENRRRGVLQRVLLESEVLRGLFDTPSGKRWLTEHDKRREVHEFVVSTKRTPERDPAPEAEAEHSAPAVPAEVLKAIEAAERAPKPDHSAKDYWVEIPAGAFRMGSNRDDPKKANYDPRAFEDESPDHDVQLNGYRIGKCPVTVAEYQQFVLEGGYATDVHWKDGGFKRWTQPENWNGQLAHPNWPVTGVSWYEAAAYAAWAKYRLPTEAEWERASRGLDARRYPWGNDDADPALANYGGLIGHVTPVGAYPRGASPEGVVDMAGNVWEWCQDTWHDSYEGAPKDGSAWITGSEEPRRVLRGGSWNYVARTCRGAFRYGDSPHDRNPVIGFRVASGT